MKWRLVGLGECGLCAVVAIFGLSRLPEDAAIGTTQSTPGAKAGIVAPSLDAELQCVQSSYVDNATNMVEPSTGLKWTHGSQSNAKSVIAVDIDT
ncbi:hypothetical protein V7S43_001902 [Phytophthora oleae]|uniref:Uncharacterized protein n=1 Tax=Phytophthora oleae TaxID=2107226 RepID=A0ABD3G312_9STRA